MKLKFIENPVKRTGAIKGSEKALNAAKKAAETRKRNRALLGIVTKQDVKKPERIKLQKIRFKQLNESNYNKISIDCPVDVYIHKTLSKIYISPHLTDIKIGNV